MPYNPTTRTSRRTYPSNTVSENPMPRPIDQRHVGGAAPRQPSGKNPAETTPTPSNLKGKLDP